ncbi:hypothetical protein [Novipirellula rosea]
MSAFTQWLRLSPPPAYRRRYVAKPLAARSNMDEPQYQVGDSVLICGGLNASKTGTIAAANLNNRRLTVSVEWFSSTMDVNVAIDDVCLLSPIRRPIIDDILKSLAHPLRLVSGCHRNAWWARKAMSESTKDPQALLIQHDAFREALDQQQSEDLLKRQSEVKTLLQKIVPEEHGEWWLANWEPYVCWGRAECERLMCDLIEPDTIERIRQEMIEGDDDLRQLVTNDPDEFDARLQSRLEPIYDELVQAGIALCRSCDQSKDATDGAT